IVGISIVFFLMFQRKIELGAFVVFTSLLTAVSDSFNKIVNVISKVYEAVSNTEDLREIMELEEEDILDGEELTEGPASIEFKNVSFMYANGNKILNDISFQVPKGSTVAIVGPSGGGKTTITKLLQRFYKPLDGSILVNDKPIDVYALGKLRQKIAVVPQDLFLYAMSIKDNICIGKLDATLDEVKECAKMADIATFIESLPDQYDTEVGERGVKLSQGQRQRIAIARALIKNASLIILDEATSALDVETENNFQVNFNKLSKNCTKIVIAHRLATVKDADYIAFVDRGKVVEYGTLEELVNLRSRFYEYWNKQINIDVR
ncbi:MAG: ATP-binding cassette domain-containing protein, partial [Lachnospiraceae bacterium]|nr:ATP-binding cassette domain-containing protein [Lachnospiraceae bacterium]